MARISSFHEVNREAGWPFFRTDAWCQCCGDQATTMWHGVSYRSTKEALQSGSSGSLGLKESQTEEDGTLYLCDKCVLLICGGMLVDLVLAGVFTAENIADNIRSRAEKTKALRSW